MPSRLDYLNPFSSEFHAIRDLKRLNMPQRAKVIVLTALGAIATFGIGTAAFFRSLVEREITILNSRGLSLTGTAKKTEDTQKFIGRFHSDILLSEIDIKVDRAKKSNFVPPGLLSSLSEEEERDFLRLACLLPEKELIFSSDALEATGSFDRKESMQNRHQRFEDLINELSEESLKKMFRSEGAEKRIELLSKLCFSIQEEANRWKMIDILERKGMTLIATNKQEKMEINPSNRAYLCALNARIEPMGLRHGGMGGSALTMLPVYTSEKISKQQVHDFQRMLLLLPDCEIDFKGETLEEELDREGKNKWNYSKEVLDRADEIAEVLLERLGPLVDQSFKFKFGGSEKKFDSNLLIHVIRFCPNDKERQKRWILKLLEKKVLTFHSLKELTELIDFEFKRDPEHKKALKEMIKPVAEKLLESENRRAGGNKTLPGKWD